MLADRYELRARIGSGGMATVWRGFDRRLGREVAVKVLSEAMAAESGSVSASSVRPATSPHWPTPTSWSSTTRGRRRPALHRYGAGKGKTLRQLLAESATCPPNGRRPGGRRPGRPGTCP